MIEPVLRAHGVEAVEITLNREQGGWVLRVTIEVPGRTEPGAGVTLDMCADVSRDISRTLDVADMIEHAYNLEVTSPGVERPLRTAAEFARFAGQPAKVMFSKALPDGQKVIRGLIEKVDGDRVTLVSDGKAIEFVVADVKQANLVFELGASPKGSKPGKSGKKKSDAGSAGSGAKAPARQQGDAVGARPTKAK
ncbi:MAG: ribosome maturation factor RimP [Polyangiaceae bacterium]